MNLAEKILAAHSDKKELAPGEFINASVDVILANDITTPSLLRSSAGSVSRRSSIQKR